MEKNKILNFQQQNNVEHVREMVLNRAIHLTDAHIVEGMVELDLTKVFLLFNRLVLNVMEMEKKLLTHATTVMDKEKNKHLKKFQ